MSDLISRKAAIKAIEDLQDCYNGFSDTYDKACIIGVLEELPSAQPTQKNESNTLDALDCVSREAVMDLIIETDPYWAEGMTRAIYNGVSKMPSARPEIIRCKDCIYYDPPHVKNNGVRYEYDEMPADAFDALVTGLVNAEYGINIGGRCCVDYYCENYSDDKRVFVREDNYCGRAERRTDE